MVASTSDDLVAYREAAVQVISQLDAEGDFRDRVRFDALTEDLETPSGAADSGLQVSQAWIERADWIVFVMGWRYGNPDPALRGHSIAEMEVKRAMDASRRRPPSKRLFVFMAGEPGGYNGYRKSPEEPVDLLQWADSTRNPQLAEARRLRTELARRFVVVFRDLPHFKARLRRTLHSAALAAIDADRAMPGLWALVIRVAPAIREVIAKVKLVTKYKEIHDELHEQLFHGVAMLTGLVATWKQSRRLDEQTEAQLRAVCLVELHDRNVRLKALLADLRALQPPGEEDPLAVAVEAVADAPDLWDFTSRRRPRVAEVEAAVDRLAAKIENAFFLADDRMFAESGMLDALQNRLLRAIARARSREPLTEREDTRLDQGLDRFRSVSEALKESLARHHRWQQAHDAYQRLLAASRLTLQKGVRAFYESMLQDFCQQHVHGLIVLIDAEARGRVPAATDRAGPLGTPLPGAGAETVTFVDQLRELERSPDNEHLAVIGNRFFAEFLSIDKKTKAQVLDAQTQVQRFENDLRALEGEYLAATSEVVEEAGP